MSVEDQLELLFFDTFSHDTSEELNLDLVQFPKSVIVRELRVIPLGARVQGEFPGGVRLGATNPSQFHIDFFVNDLNKPGASTFESLGSLEYSQNGHIHLECPPTPDCLGRPTDGLVLKGWYTTITLAVYGTLSRAAPDGPGASQTQAARPSIPREVAPGGDWEPDDVEPVVGYGESELRRDDYDTPHDPRARARDRRRHRARSRSRSPRSRSRPRSPHSELAAEPYPTYRPPPCIRSPSREAEIPVPTPTAGPAPAPDPDIEMSPATSPHDVEPFEPILSDEDICDELEPDDDRDADDGTDRYDPYTADWTSGERDDTGPERDDTCVALHELRDELAVAGRDPDPASFLAVDGTLKEEWVDRCERLQAPLRDLLEEGDAAVRIFSSRTDGPYQLLRDGLTALCSVGLDYGAALSHHSTYYKIRHTKCGVRLAETLAAHRHGGLVCASLLRTGVDLPRRLMRLYAEKHMALSVRLMILKALSACLDSRQLAERFVNEPHYPDFEQLTGDEVNGYRCLLSVVRSDPLSRIKFAVGALITKLNLHELLADLRARVCRLQAGTGGDEDADAAAHALDELIHLYRTRGFSLAQHRRLLPAAASFCGEGDGEGQDGHRALLVMLEQHRTVAVCAAVAGGRGARTELATRVLELLREMLRDAGGVRLLARAVPASHLLFRALVGPDPPPERAAEPVSEGPRAALELAFKLRALRLLDELRAHMSRGPPDEAALADRLQALYCLALQPSGRVAVPDVLALGDHAEYIVRVLEEAPGEPAARRGSPAKGYAADLLSVTVKSSADATFLRRYARRLLRVTRDHDRYEPGVSCLLQELAPYLKPADSARLLAGEDVTEGTDILRAAAEATEEPGGELLTALRLLHAACLPGPHSALHRSLARDRCLLQLHAQDGVSSLLGVLTAAAERHEPPAPPPAGHVAHLLELTMLPALELLAEMVSRVVRARGADHRDCSAAPVLVRVYCVLQGAGAERAAGAAVKALLAHLQAGAGWAAVCRALLQPAPPPPRLPACLALLAELLPLPLPVLAARELTAERAADLRAERRLWAAHLRPLKHDVADLVRRASAAAHRPVARALRRVCVQLADLAPDAASTVMRAAVAAGGREPRGGAAQARALDLLACLAEHAPLKLALLRSPEPGLALLRDALAGPGPPTAHEAAAHALAALCDAEVALRPPRNSRDVADWLPAPSALDELLDAAAGRLGAEPRSPAAQVALLRVFFVLTEHERGFLRFRRLIARRREDFAAFFSWAVRGGEQSGECLALYLELARALCCREEGEGGVARGGELHTTELEALVGCRTGEEWSLLRERGGDEEVLANIEYLEGRMAGAGEECPAPPPDEPEPELTPVSDLWEERSLTAAGAPSDDRLTAAYWLHVPDQDAPHDDTLDELVPCDIAAIAEAELGSTGGAAGLMAALRRVLALPPADVDAAALRGTAASRGRGGAICAAGAAAGSDMFRLRPPNTSRPPSLHVDDFTALERAPVYGKTAPNRGGRRGAGVPSLERGRFPAGGPHAHYRHVRGRGAWEMGAQHFSHFGPSPHYMMGGMGRGGAGGAGGGGGRLQRGMRHRNNLFR